MRVKRGWADKSQVFGVGDILWIREETTGLIDYLGKDQPVSSDRTMGFHTDYQQER